MVLNYCLVVSATVVVIGLLFRGWPTPISQRWLGWPCGGFMPGAVGAVVGVTVVIGLLIFVFALGATVGLLLSGWPTAISHRWPGWPCAGFKPLALLAVTVFCVCAISLSYSAWVMVWPLLLVYVIGAVVAAFCVTCWVGCCCGIICLGKLLAPVWLIGINCWLLFGRMPAESIMVFGRLFLSVGLLAVSLLLQAINKRANTKTCFIKIYYA
jgi:hypothetical protein